MDFREFAGLIPAYGDIFTKDEQQEIIQTIASEDFMPKLFNDDIRNTNPFDSDSEAEEYSEDEKFTSESIHAF